MDLGEGNVCVLKYAILICCFTIFFFSHSSVLLSRDDSSASCYEEIGKIVKIIEMELLREPKKVRVFLWLHAEAWHVDVKSRREVSNSVPIRDCDVSSVTKAAQSASISPNVSRVGNSHLEFYYSLNSKHGGFVWEKKSLSVISAFVALKK